MSLLKDSGYKNIAKCIERTFTQVDDESRALDSINIGSTACTAFITIENKVRTLYVANAGDTRAILIKADGHQRLSYEHKATDPGEVIRLQYFKYKR